MVLSRVPSSRSLMDKISVCGTDAPGSTPGESTIRTSPKGVFLMMVVESGTAFRLEKRSASRSCFEIDCEWSEQYIQNGYWTCNVRLLARAQNQTTFVKGEEFVPKDEYKKPATGAGFNILCWIGYAWVRLIAATRRDFFRAAVFSLIIPRLAALSIAL